MLRVQLYVEPVYFVIAFLELVFKVLDEHIIISLPDFLDEVIRIVKTEEDIFVHCFIVTYIHSLNILIVLFHTPSQPS